jgi:hypothetical protein
VFPHHLKFALPRLISSPDLNPEDIIPDGQGIRDAAVSAVQQGIREFGNDLAALGPVDSASGIDSQDGIDSSLPDDGEAEMRRMAPNVASSYTPSAPSRPAASISASSRRMVASAADPSVANGQFRARGGGVGGVDRRAVVQ